jgi:uncharacterized membrane protein
MATNPYAAPQARVADAAPPALADDFIPEGQALSAGRGWAWIGEGWQLFRATPWVWIGIAAVVLVGYAAINVVPLGQIAVMLLTPVFAGGLLAGCRAVEEGGEIRFGHLIEGFSMPQTGRLVTLGAITLGATVLVVALIFVLIWATVGLAAFSSRGGGVMLVGLLAALGVLALTVPIYMALWFAPALVVFHDYGAVDALKASFFACLKNVVPFLLYGIGLLLWSIVALIPLGLGFLVLTPVVIASVYAGYRDVFFR